MLWVKNRKKLETTMIKGCKKYIPPNILEELRNIKQEENIERDCDAFRRLAENSAYGRQAKREQWIFIRESSKK